MSWRELQSSAAVLRHPGRAGLLWAGSAASPALHAFILVAVYDSLSGGLTPLDFTLVPHAWLGWIGLR